MRSVAKIKIVVLIVSLVSVALLKLAWLGLTITRPLRAEKVTDQLLLGETKRVVLVVLDGNGSMAIKRDKARCAGCARCARSRQFARDDFCCFHLCKFAFILHKQKPLNIGYFQPSTLQSSIDLGRRPICADKQTDNSAERSI